MAVTMLPPETLRELGRREAGAKERAAARLLVVDDDARNARLLKSLLTARAYEVITATSGQDALAAISSASVDLLLLDAMMPGMSGFDVCETLRSDTGTRLLPILMITALDSVDEKVRALACGADDFLGKPVNRVELLARVASLLRVKKLRDEVDEARRDLAEKDSQLRSIEAGRTKLTQML